MATNERPGGNRGAMTVGQNVIPSVPHEYDEPALIDIVSTAYGRELALIRRDDGVRRVTEASDEQSRAVIDQAIRLIGETHGSVNANAIRDLLPAERPALIGARFLALAKQGKLEKVGYVQATHAAGHGRMIADWRWIGG